MRSTGFSTRFGPIALLAAALWITGCQSAAPPTPQAIYATPTPGTAQTAEPTDAPYEGSGVITFGASYNTNTLKIIKPAKTFKTSVKVIAWSAELREPAGATKLDVIIATRNAAGTEGVVYTYEAAFSDPSFQLSANKADLAAILDHKPGGYVMRYLRGATVLAEGSFTLVK